MAEPTTEGAEYQRVAAGLRARIKDMQPGDEIASLQEIMDAYGVGIMVARRALMELRVEGVIKTRQGKKAVVIDPTAARSQSDDVRDLMQLIDDLQREIREQGFEMTQWIARVQQLLRILQVDPASLDSAQPPPRPPRPAP